MAWAHYRDIHMVIAKSCPGVYMYNFSFIILVYCEYFSYEFLDSSYLYNWMYIQTLNIYTALIQSGITCVVLIGSL